MRVLLDECLPRRLKRELAGHDARTAPEMGWASKRNGDLLRTAAAGGFEAFLTVDRNLQHQQHLSAFAIAVIVLEAPSNTLADLRPLIPEVLSVLPKAPKGEATVVRGRDARRLTND